jgi:hypothetical protein
MGFSSSIGKQRRSSLFLSNTTWTVPDGVFYVEVEAVGGGAGASGGLSAGSDTTVALTGGTITAPGMASAPNGNVNTNVGAGTPGTGEGRKGLTGGNFSQGGSRDEQVARNNVVPKQRGGGAVTPGAGISVTIGAGASSGAQAGGSGYAIIRWEQ